MATEGFLPTIKCSDCGVGIEISQLADHVCVSTSSYNEQPTSSKLDRAATLAGASFNDRRNSPPRSARMPPPPRIDPHTANKPFYPDNLSPMSSNNDPKSPSALSPASGKHSMNRSATSPLPQSHLSPSADLPSNMDSPFAPFPANWDNTAKASDRLEPSPSYDYNYAQPSPLFAPLSPRTNGGESIVKRMDTIAPGPFDGRPDDRRPSTSSGPRTPGYSATQFGHKRTNTQGSVKSNGAGSNSRISATSNVSRGSAFSNGSYGLPSRPKPGMGPFAAMAPPPPPPPPKDERAEGIDAFLARLQQDTLEPSKVSQDSRSKTFPMRQETRDAMEPPARLSERKELPRRPTDIDSQLNYMLSSRTYNPGVSPRNDLPPVPPVLSYTRDFPADALHTPSDSGLSEDSYASSGFRSIASSRSSPPLSEASHSRQASKISRPDDLNEEQPIRRTVSPEMFLDPRPVPPQPESRRAKTPEPLLQPPKAPYIGAPESPLDPAIQKGLLYEARKKEAMNAAVSAPQTRLEPAPQREMVRRPTAASKGRCRGCSEEIFGKSVKDSSGRLTGRYHKECFVCRYCQDPFPTAEFYVFNNFPHCEQHYHQLNGSLCRACNRGIEGQYLETDQRLKFHPRCFACSTCRIVLRDDYYQVGGRNYCERHAYSTMNQQNQYLGPGNNNNNRMRNLQKRRTRMMMME